LAFILEQIGAQTETELKEKKLRVEDALNATKVCMLHLCSYAYIAMLTAHFSHVC